MSENQNMTPAEQLELEEAPNVYSYHEASRVLVGVDKADLDALTYQMHQRIEWLVPANATLLAPPQFDPESHVVVFDPEAVSWSIVAKPALPANPEAPLPSLEEQREAVIRSIDARVDEIVQRTIGNRATEYLVAEQEALAYKLAGYPEGGAPLTVEDDMLAFGRTAKDAADAILAQAAAWRTAQQAMRRHRLMSKTAARNAGSVEDLGVVIGQWQAFVTHIEEQLGV